MLIPLSPSTHIKKIEAATLFKKGLLHLVIFTGFHPFVGDLQLKYNLDCKINSFVFASEYFINRSDVYLSQRYPCVSEYNIPDWNLTYVSVKATVHYSKCVPKKIFLLIVIFLDGMTLQNMDNYDSLQESYSVSPAFLASSITWEC